MRIPIVSFTPSKAWLSLLSLSVALSVTAAETDPFVKREPPPLIGRWDLKVRDGGHEYPSWLEVEQSGFRTFIGAYVGQFGSARPIGNIGWDDASGRFRFVLPPQWEHRTNDIVFTGRLAGDVLHGETTDDQGRVITWEGRRAPSLTPHNRRSGASRLRCSMVVI